jgi:hypothetical protein
MLFRGTSLCLLKRAVIVTLMTTAGVNVKTLSGNKVAKKHLNSGAFFELELIFYETFF